MSNQRVEACKNLRNKIPWLYKLLFNKKRIMIILYRSIAVHSCFYLKARQSRCVHRASIHETTNTHTIYDVKAQFNNIRKGLFCAKCDLCSTFSALQSRVLCTGTMCVYMNIGGGNKNFLRYGRCRHPIRTY